MGGAEGRLVAVRPGRAVGSLDAPPSKSVTNRLLAMAALAGGESKIVGPLLSEDTEAMAGALGALGIEVELDSRRARVGGRAGTLHPTGEVVDAGLSGTTLRFLAALSLLADGPVVLDGGPGLRRRPLAGLLGALRETGATVRSEDGHAPLRIEPGGLKGGRLRVDAGESSQFASAILLVAPYAETDVELRIENLAAGGYVELTAELMRSLGAEVGKVDGAGYLVRAGAHYAPGRYETEYDASAAAHLFALASASGGEVTVTNATATLQPDGAVPSLLAEMGGEVVPGQPSGLTVRASGGRLQPIVADLARMPDQLPTLASLAALADGESRFSGLAVSRGHESDRPSAVASELSRLGCEVSLEDDELIVRGGRALQPARIDSHGDHRMAMAFSALATVVDGIVISGAECVAKTYPGWWEALGRLGLSVESL